MPQVETEVGDLPTVLAPTPDLPYREVDPATEFDRQVAVYEALGAAELLGAAGTLTERVAPLRAYLGGIPSAPGAAEREDAAAFVLVLPSLDPNDLAPAMRRGDRRGLSVIGREEMAGYAPVPGVDVPTGPYLVTGIDVGSDFRGVAPQDALAVIRDRGRTGLTITEGVALATVRPDLLRPNRCWSLLASRAGNRRVPAVWISERRAKLGWCWDGNPHTWLGAASAGGRVTA